MTYQKEVKMIIFNILGLNFVKLNGKRVKINQLLLFYIFIEIVFPI